MVLPMQDDLAEQLGRRERDDLEFKRGASDRHVLREAICALSNDLPGRGTGHLLLGVEDDGTPSDLTVDDELLRLIAGFRDDGRVLPAPVLSVEEGRFAGRACVHVTVSASPSPPVRYGGRVYVRVGPTTRVATRDEERMLAERRRAADLPFDQHAMPGPGLDDLDLELFRSTYLPAAVSPETLAENERSVEEQLVSLRLLDPAADPTALGILLLGYDPSGWLPGAYVQFVRYEGDDEGSSVQDHEEFRGNLIDQLDALERLLPANIHTAILELGGLRQGDAPDYPLPALRELVVNALMHRNYETSNAPVRILWFANRVEITSPGGPYGAVTAENFDKRNDYRNPALAAAMKDLGFVNRFGRGISLVRSTLAANGNQPAEFQIEPTYWGVVVRATA
jgi:ATP-dependent DNA helicase RecG